MPLDAEFFNEARFGRTSNGAVSFGNSEEKGGQHGRSGKRGMVAPEFLRRRNWREGFLLGEEQRENTETFGERHTDDGLNEDFARGTGVATDGFGSFGADEADADGGAEETECASDVAGDGGFSEDGHGSYIYWLEFRRARSLARSQR
jgi:hypothetical protein